MSARTAEDLSDRLAEDLIWRKKELTIFKDLLRRAEPARKKAVQRALVAMLYAHWEGYVKNASRRYLEHLAMRRLLYSELTSNFVALGLQAQIRDAARQRNHAALTALIDWFRTGMASRSRIPHKDGLDTAANLSSEVLREITSALGLSYAHFETKTVLLDERLLSARNRIAHGEYLELDEAAVLELVDEVQGMMEHFRTLIENAVALGAYRYSG